MFEEMIDMYESYEPKTKTLDRKYESLRDFKEQVEEFVSRSLVRAADKGYTMEIEKGNNRNVKQIYQMETE